ncbi:hypothetical protein [Halarchaeum sp. P4]|uniref:hypothetical protein n=1 Tax=Halarchaeum sp. P4 TaxID=3421639 RepID=UPI003EC0EC78
MTRTALALCLALLLVGAGCTGTTGPTGDTTTDATPASAADIAGPLPGISADGVSNLSATLAAGDRNTTAGFVAVVNATVVRPDSRTYWNDSIRAAPGGDTYVTTHREHGTGWNSTLVSWSNGSVAATKQTSSGETTYRLSDPSGPVRPSDAVADVLRMGNFTVVNATGAGDAARLVLRATGPSAAASDRRTNYSGTLRLDERGRPRAATITYVTTTGARNVTTHVDFRLDRLGNVAVERPAWVSQAEWPAPKAAFDFGSENGSVVVTHHTGNTLDGARVRVTDATTNESVTRRVNATLSAGVRLYVYRSDGAIRVGTEQPRDAVALSGTYRVAVLDAAHGVYVDSGTVTVNATA